MTDTAVPRHPVFVVGMPRSGTTLLSSLLDAHPQLVIAPETHYFTRCWTGERIRSRDDAERMLDRLNQQPGVHDMDLSAEEWQTIRDRLFDGSEPTHADILRALLETYAARTTAGAWGEKTPDHLRHVPEMARQFPTAVFVAIIRDPRDVCLSLRSMPWSRDTVVEQAWTWRDYAARIDRYSSEYGDRFFHLRYEDLIREPEEILRALCRFLDMPYESSMVRRTGQDDQPFDAEREPWKQKSNRPIDPSNREKWRTEMPEGERILVELIAGRWLTTYGYLRPQRNWTPGLVGEVGRRAGQSAIRWVGRTLRNLRSGRTFRDDASPQWLEDSRPT